MLFPTATFAVFLLVVLTLSWALMDRPRAWRPFMLAASYFFYGWWDWKFVFLLVASTLVNHVAAVAIWRTHRRRVRKAWLTAAVAFDLGLLAYFKYAGFFVSSVENVLARIGVAGASAVVNAALPVGISFYTFMAISYVVDVYRRELEPSSLSRFAVYLSFFPHLVAGPIVRGRELLPQLTAPRDPRRVDTTRAYYLILTGLFLKVVIANHLATHLVDDAFAAPNRHSSLEMLAAVYGYAVQIFADFCGYTNIAIGIALLLGFEFPQNFASPYAAVSLQDFWRRWHMTLSRWLRDYLYIPLGGSRKGRLRTYRNLMLTMPTAIASTTDVVTSGELCPHASNRRTITSRARENESARKKIHAKQTTWKVRTRPSHTCARVCGFHPVARSTARPSPWMPPHTTKVHAAPCQRPPSNIVSSRLRYVKMRPFRFPPSGM
jgi:alginate O-acetyltransferase complex protein AlgI